MNIPIPYDHVRQRTGETRREKQGDFALFSTDERVFAIESPIKRLILGMIGDRGTSFEKIVNITGKAKSTISVHLRDLEEAGLIRSDPDPSDQRKRILTLVSDPVGRLTSRDRSMVRRQSPDQEEVWQPESRTAVLYQQILREIRTEALIKGIHIDPILEQAGQRIGSRIRPLFHSDSLAEMAGKMDQFWRTHELGRITLVTEDPLTIRVDDCFECRDLPVTGHGSCSFDTGVLTAVFSPRPRARTRVSEVECYSSGSDHCSFIISHEEMAGEPTPHTREG